MLYFHPTLSLRNERRQKREPWKRTVWVQVLRPRVGSLESDRVNGPSEGWYFNFKLLPYIDSLTKATKSVSGIVKAVKSWWKFIYLLMVYLLRYSRLRSHCTGQVCPLFPKLFWCNVNRSMCIAALQKMLCFKTVQTAPVRSGSHYNCHFKYHLFTVA